MTGWLKRREEAWRTQAVRGRGGRGGRWEGPTGVGTKQREAEALIRSSEAAVEVRIKSVDLAVERTGIGVGFFPTDGGMKKERVINGNSMCCTIKVQHPRACSLALGYKIPSYTW